jgi:signal transduction histidine kinase
VSISAHEGDGNVTIEVVDRGRGIHPDEADALLEPFARGEAVAHGAGLGLAIAHGFAVANGGSVSLAAREGGGTRACLTLPAERVATEALQ